MAKKALWRQVRSERSADDHVRREKARQRARTELARRHPEEFKELFDAEKAKEGL